MVATMRYLLKVASILVFGMASQGVSAYEYILCGNGDPVYAGEGVRTFDYGTNLFDDEVTAFSAAFIRLSEFSAASATLGVEDPAPALSNNQNEIWWDGSVGTAVCSTRWNNNTDCVVIESDIRIGDLTWYAQEDSNHTPYGSSGRPVHGVALHEGGHCVGLGHTNNVYSIMGHEWTHVDRNNTTTFYGPGEDGSDGLIDLHGERSGGADTYRDVSVTTWRYDFASGAYSAHKQGRLLDAGGIEHTKTGLQWVGQDEYTINAGETLQMEYTTENNGEGNSENVELSFRLSTNPIISTLDTEIGYALAAASNRGTPWERTQSGLVIPIGTAPGDYWVGVIADVNNAIPETQEGTNNYAHYPIIIPPPDLTVTAPSVSDTTPTTTQVITGYATINNVGGAQSAATTLRYYRSTNSTISTSDTEVDTDAQAIIDPDASIDRSEPFVFSATAGTYWYGACVDTVPGETVTNNQCSSGVQVIVRDEAPPTPNPMTFSTFPHELNDSQIAMTATTATEPSGGVEYFFDYTSSPTSGPGGSDSGWQSGTNYTDSGLGPNENYCYRVSARDTYGNQTGYSVEDCDYTAARSPASEPFGPVTQTSIEVRFSANGNPAGTEYLVQNTTTGTFSGTLTTTTWLDKGLACNTSYNYEVRARNGDLAQTGIVRLGVYTTAPCGIDADGDGIDDSVDNCTLVFNPGQEDANGDLIGNICDADVSGPGGVEDCVVNFLDLAAFKEGFFGSDPELDLDGSGSVNFIDLGIVKSQFFGPPGPSASGCN